MRKNFRLSLLALVAFFGLAVVGCKPLWSKEFKTEVTDAVAFKLVMMGAEDYAMPLAVCIVNHVEAKVSEKDFKAAQAEGRDPDVDIGALLKDCACNVVKDPRALAHPTFCK